MARYVPRTYKNHRAARFFAKFLIGLVIAAVLLAVSLFFGLRRYVVYTPDGLRLEISWLDNTEPDG
ncbi:MAG: hypothetical protein LBN99_02330 [Oscillospiraceae bacterium]|jgi:hypothetical protein|nr:hypothetical protein [Oscillospiraceae bacterium]